RLSFSQTRYECIQRQIVRVKAHTADSREADQKKSRGSEEGCDFPLPDSRGRNIALARALPNRSSELQTDGRYRINQPRTRFAASTESSVAAALKRHDVRTYDGAHQLRGSRRSARLRALGRGVTLAYPSASRGGYGSDDNSL